MELEEFLMGRASRSYFAESIGQTLPRSRFARQMQEPCKSNQQKLAFNIIRNDRKNI